MPSLQERDPNFTERKSGGIVFKRDELVLWSRALKNDEKGFFALFS